MSLLTACVRRLSVLGAAWVLLCASSISPAEVRVEPDLQDAETVALARRVQEELSAVSSGLTSVDVRVTIGSAAFRAALAKDDGKPLIAAYLTSTEFEAALGSRRPTHITAIFSNPDPLDEVFLAQTLRRNAAIGVYDSRTAHSLVVRLKNSGVRVIAAPPSTGIDALLRAADALDVIVVLPDPSVFNRSNINHVVRTLYQRRTVLVGYSATLTRVGSLASVFPTAEAIAKRAADVVGKYASGNALPPPIFVRDVDVAVNERLARSLNIAVPSRAEILVEIRSKGSITSATP